MNLQLFLPIFLFCSGVAIISAEVECPPEGVVFYPHPNCSMYYLCFNGNPIEQLCPPGTYFNPILRECDFPLNVPECQGGTRPPEGSTTTGPITNQTTVVTTQAPPTNRTTTEVPDGILRNCGDVYEGTSGRIEYKLREAYDENELCAFVINLPGQPWGGIAITLEEEGLEESTNYLGAIAIFGFDNEGLTTTEFMGPPNAINGTFVPSDTVVIIFNTPAGYYGNSTGFSLSFERTGEPDIRRYPWVGYVIGESSGQVKYPQFGDYEEDVQAIFVISAEHKRIVGNNTFLQLSITDAGINQQCWQPGCMCDALFIYSFVGGDEDIALQQRFCDPETQEAVFETKGVFILLFTTDRAGTGRGFTAEWDIKSL